eukprot:SAG31_NODE_604_length_13629_cov_11.035994_9_plen_136_part_00
MRGTACGLREEYGMVLENLSKGLAYARIANPLKGFCECTDESCDSKLHGCGAGLRWRTYPHPSNNLYYDKYIIKYYAVMAGHCGTRSAELERRSLSAQQAYVAAISSAGRIYRSQLTRLLTAPCASERCTKRCVC